MALTTLDFSKNLRDLDGNEVEGSEMKKILANLFANGQSKEPSKWNDWSLDLWTKGRLEVDSTDLEKIKNFIIESTALNNIGKAQMLDVFKEAPDRKDKQVKGKDLDKK